MRIAQRAIAAMFGALVVLGSVGTVHASNPADVYPPHDVIIQVVPPACIQPKGDTIQLNGTVDGFDSGTTVTITATLNGAPFGSPITVQVDGNFHAAFSIPIPPNTQGTLVVTATGIKADTKQQFSVSTTVQLTLCVLPPTGSAHVQEWLSYAGLAVLAGIFLVVAVSRRRHHAGAAS